MPESYNGGYSFALQDINKGRDRFDLQEIKKILVSPRFKMGNTLVMAVKKVDLSLACTRVQKYTKVWFLCKSRKYL